jgi:hypothetical protein
MAYTTIKKPSDYFNTKLYTGTGSSNAITGVGFQPDFTWIKMRSGTGFHKLVDAVRGVTKEIYSNDASAEFAQTQGLTAFGTDGFTLGTDANYNGNSSTFASWNWLANGAGSANTDGTITSTVSANTTSGFSIVKWTGNETAGATVGHGLGSTPKMIIIKRLTGGTTQWVVYHVSTGNTKACYLNTTTTPVTVTGFFNNTTPTSSVFTIGNDTACNGNSNEMIAYCFAEKQGYSKFGSYTGNGNADGTFVYTGFKPAFIMSKSSTNTEQWIMKDVARDTFNPVEKNLSASSASSEAGWGTAYDIDILSNGFKMRDASGQTNGNGFGFIYMAFAEQPLVGDNPATAR